MKETLFDIFLAELNNNTSGLVYKGNFLFMFHESSMSVYELTTGTLVKEEIKYSPVSLQIAQPVIFTENNGRIDWLMQCGLLVRVAGAAYDSTVDLDYENVIRACSALNGSTTTSGGKTYSLKVSPPDYQGYNFLGNSKYMTLFVTINATEITKGEYSQASTWKLNGEELDCVEIQISATKRYYTADDKTALTNDYNKAIGTATLFVMTFNYDPTSALQYALYKEARGKGTVTDTYTLTELTSKGDTLTWIVTMRHGNEIWIRNSVKKLTIELVETI